MEPEDARIPRRPAQTGQLSRTIHRQIRVQEVVAFKPMWWLSAMNGNRNDLTGKVWPTGDSRSRRCGGRRPPPPRVLGTKYDEDDVEYFHGERGVLDTGTEADESMEQATSNRRWWSRTSDPPLPRRTGPLGPTEAEVR